MRWLDTVIDRLAEAHHWSYHHGGASATEPTALSALALLAHGRQAAADRAVDWITRTQATTGAVGITADDSEPCWPTALAILAWQAWNKATDSLRYRGCIERAVHWALTARGNTSPNSPLIGHDSTLAGWPWVEGTHSWLEPTAYFVLALKAAGHRRHARTREAVRLLVDRLLPSGGCNYGNTVVMGQELLPHVQPTGLVLLALADEPIEDTRVVRSIEYLERTLGPDTTAASLAFGLLGLSAHNRRPKEAEAWLEAVHARHAPFPPRAYTDALLALAGFDASLSLWGHISNPEDERPGGY